MRFLVLVAPPQVSVEGPLLGNLPPFFSIAEANHQIPKVTGVRDLGVPLDRTFTSALHCRKAIVLHVPQIILRTIQNSVLFPLYCAKVRSYLEYAMEANAPTLTANIN